MNILSWNKAAEKAYGYTAEEAIELRMSSLFQFETEGITPVNKYLR
ncbi:MAG: PAS domain S-box protein [Bacteroidetes bacterium]|nr:PAS domain S-box protein [Bacteroidota bacterium]